MQPEPNSKPAKEHARKTNGNACLFHVVATTDGCYILFLKMKINKHILFTTLALLWCAAAFAQQLSLIECKSMSDNKFQLVYKLSNASSCSAFTPPEVSGAELKYKTQGQEIKAETSIGNGKVRSNSSRSYIFRLTFKANQTGKLKVGRAYATVGGKKIASKESTIIVEEKGASTSRSAMQQPWKSRTVDPTNPFTQGVDKDVTANDLFVKIELSKPRVYEQQAVVCTVKLFTKFPIKEFFPLQQPEYNGFLIEDITPKMPASAPVEQYNGQNYYTAILRKSILYPQKSGTLTINSGEFDVLPVKRQVFVGLNVAIAVPVDGNKLRIKSNAASVNIMPLPSPRPAGFTGAVGEFSISDAITPNQQKTFATGTYTLKVSGSGNIKYIKAPSIAFPKEFDTFDPQNKINTSSDGSDVKGDVTFTYQFIPQQVGQFAIGQGEFVYFNPNTEKYETLTLPAHTLHIAKGKDQPSNTADGAKKMTDIYPVHSGDLHLSKTHTLWLDRWTYWALLLLPFAFFTGILVYYRKLVKERANVQLMRVKRAGKVAQKRLKQAKQYMDHHLDSEFYAEVLTALWGYLSDKLGIPVSELSKDNIDAELQKYGVSEALRKQLLQLLEQCEYAQYTPELSRVNKKSVFEEAAKVMEDLENVKRINPSSK